jgi:hypothetical protein
MLVPGNHPDGLDERLAVGLDRKVAKLPVEQRRDRYEWLGLTIRFELTASC